MSYSDEVLADSPVAWYTLDETSGTTLTDSSGNGRDGTWSGTPTRGVTGIAGTTGTAFQSGTGSGYASVADASWNSFTGAFSIEVWHKPNGTDPFLVEKYTTPAVNGYAFRMSSGKPQMLTMSSSLSSITAPSVVSQAVWHQYVFTHDGTNGRLYVDGALVAGPTAMVVPTDGAASLKIGARGDDSVVAAAGVIDEVSLYSGALSAARVLAHYNAGNTAPTPTGPVAGTLPALTGSASGTTSVPVFSGPVAGALPALTGSAEGTHTSNDQVGTVAGTLPALTGSVSVDFTPAPTTGTVDATLPALSGASDGELGIQGSVHGTLPSLTGLVIDFSIDRTGAVTGSLPSLSGQVVGLVENGEIPPPTDDFGNPMLEIDTEPGGLDVFPPLALPPDGYTERPIMRRSVVVPDLRTIVGAYVDPDTNMVRVPDDVYDALPVTEAEVGVPHIIYRTNAGIYDKTYFRGGITRLGTMRMEEPFGDTTFEFDVPLLTSLDDEVDSDSHPLNWTRNRANVEVVLAKPDGTIQILWTGHIVAHDIGNDQNGSFRRISCVGSMQQAATDVLKVPNMLDPTDIGTLIPRALNAVASRRYPKVPNVTTGIKSRQRGSWSDSPLGYAQGLLATAWTDSGNQWTVAKVPGSRRTYEMRLKETTPTVTVTNGARGVSVDLTRDQTTTRNVVYGHGVAPNGYAWWNYKYPNLSADDAPLYPGSLMGLGASGAGVTLWQRRVRDLGYTIAIDGTISSSDVLIIKTIQRRYGLLVDGIIGPQTWAATFDVGGNGGDLSGVVRLPLAADPATQRWLYNADGSIAGENPEFNPNVIIYADDIDFGSGITRAEGIKSAQQIIDREAEPGLTGRIVLNSDPREMSRALIRPGQVLKLVGFEQADRILHIAAVEVDLDSLTVTLEVDEKSRDAMTLAQIRERDREARKDPARRPGNANRRSRLDVDQVVPYDGESGAGRVPKFALYGGLWSVIRIPVSEVGRVAKIDLKTTGPASKFCVALFGSPIQPAHLVSLVGNPLANADGWKNNRETLEDTYGWIEGVGSPDQAAGYWPGLESDGDPLTGRLVDTGGFEYVSAKPPWVWVAFYAASSCYVEGRILPAPVV